MQINDPVTVTLKFERPATDQALMEGISAMVGAIPKGWGGSTRMRLTLEGISDDLAATIETAFAIGKAQLAVRAKRRKPK